MHTAYRHEDPLSQRQVCPRCASTSTQSAKCLGSIDSTWCLKSPTKTRVFPSKGGFRFDKSLNQLKL